MADWHVLSCISRGPTSRAGALRLSIFLLGAAFSGCDAILDIHDVSLTGGTGGTGGSPLSSSSATSASTSATTTFGETGSGATGGGGSPGGTGGGGADVPVGCSPPICDVPPCWPEVIAGVHEEGISMPNGVVTGIASFGGVLYWGAKEGSAAILATTSPGAPSTVLVPGLTRAPFRIVVDDTGVFWASKEETCVRALLSGTTTPFAISHCGAADMGPFAGLAVDEDRVYWVVRAVSICGASLAWNDCCTKLGQGCVVFAKKAPSDTVPQVQYGHMYPRAIAADGAEVFWTDGLPGIFKYRLRRCPKAQVDCAPITFVGGAVDEFQRDILPIGEDLYYTDFDGLRRKPKSVLDSTAGELIIATQPSTTPPVTDGAAVYIGENDGAIHKVLVAGGPASVVPHTEASHADMIAVDDAYVYWTEAGCVLRAPK